MNPFLPAWVWTVSRQMVPTGWRKLCPDTEDGADRGSQSGQWSPIILPRQWEGHEFCVFLFPFPINPFEECLLVLYGMVLSALVLIVFPVLDVACMVVVRTFVFLFYPLCLVQILCSCPQALYYIVIWILYIIPNASSELVFGSRRICGCEGPPTLKSFAGVRLLIDGVVSLINPGWNEVLGSLYPILHLVA